MAFDIDGLFAVMGKRIKARNVWFTYIAAIEAHKNDMQDILDTEGLGDLYVPLPATIENMQQTITGWITSLIQDDASILTDREYVLEQLPISDFTETSVLNAIFDYMVDNSETIKASIVTLGGSDVNQNSTQTVSSDQANERGPQLYVTRILDGNSAPGNGVSANVRFSGLESQLARTTTIYGRIDSNVVNAEQVTIFSSGPETGPYEFQDEEPSLGPTLTNANSGLTSNFDFSTWVTGSPSDWTMSGVSPTNWVDASGTGAGPLQLKTINVTASQQITGLQALTMYFVAVSFRGYGDGVGADNVTMSLRMRNAADTYEYMGASAKTVTIPNNAVLGYAHQITGQAYGFFQLGVYDDLDDIYLEAKMTDAPATGFSLHVEKIVLTAVTYWNGVGIVFFSPEYTGNGGISPIYFTELGTLMSMNIVNGGQGVIQTAFRRDHNFQFPTADSPTIADSLAT